ncbi:hypothetical protein NQ314_020619 [Rhamnusium bicolor]|uniref:PiggyBac transposable element-derived protein domain-containing protein n=1 Tax=Rhamnusium bicolor TaxID=1586634 RepID=A0AAV8WK65_9CUCU|nr:hypothetical protein NQ314_020619 [Rhamnusium bicolor]
MDTRMFYGSRTATNVRDIPDGSEDEIMSDDVSQEDYVNLSPDSDYNPDTDKENEDPSTPQIIPETDSDSDDDIPLTELVSKWNRNLNLKEMLSDIVYQSMLYSTEKRPKISMVLTEEELEQFIGTCLYISIVQLPSTRSYWNLNLNHRLVSEVMSCNSGHDKLYKIRLLLDKPQERLLKVPKKEYLAIDEQIIPTKAHSSLKQYNPNKTRKGGYKAFVLSGVSGFSYDYEIYAGSESNVVLDGNPDLGVSSNTVVRLAQTIPRHFRYKLFFDNWFNSIQLQVYLTKVGIFPLGTVRINRVPNCNMPKESELKRQGRGAMIEKVAKFDGTCVFLVSWFNNKIVNMMSTYIGTSPKIEVNRYSRKDNSYITVKYPQSVAICNKYMGGVDLLDSMLGYYRIIF